MAPIPEKTLDQIVANALKPYDRFDQTDIGRTPRYASTQHPEVMLSVLRNSLEELDPNKITAEAWRSTEKLLQQHLEKHPVGSAEHAKAAEFVDSIQRTIHPHRPVSALMPKFAESQPVDLDRLVSQHDDMERVREMRQHFRDGKIKDKEDITPLLSVLFFTDDKQAFGNALDLLGDVVGSNKKIAPHVYGIINNHVERSEALSLEQRIILAGFADVLANPTLKRVRTDASMVGLESDRMGLDTGPQSFKSRQGGDIRQQAREAGLVVTLVAGTLTVLDMVDARIDEAIKKAAKVARRIAPSKGASAQPQSDPFADTEVSSPVQRLKNALRPRDKPGPGRTSSTPSPSS